MQDYFKKYLLGCLFFLLLVMISGSFNSFLSEYKLNLLATAFNPTSLPADADPVSGYAWSDNIGWINFGEGTERTASRAYLSNDEMYGYVWAENAGWISLSCDNDDSCSTSDYGVTQTSSDGTLTGQAWGENIGWIDFAPTGGGVTVTTNTSGTNTFSGYAWGENIGWVSFSGDSPEYGVTTTWTKPSGGGGTTYQTCSYEYSDWTECIDGSQTRTVSPDPNSCSNSSDSLAQFCTTATTTATSTIATTTGISISISPASSTVFTKEKVQFTATVTGTTTNNSVDWSIFPVETIIQDFYGSIDNTGLYTAPGQAVAVTIQARPKADTSKLATASVSVRLKPSPISISISPASSTIAIGENIQFTATVTGTTTNNKITWKILPEEELIKDFYGTISETGFYTAPQRAVNITVQAKSQADTTKVADAKVNVRLKIVEPEATTTLPIVNGLTDEEISGDITNADYSDNRSANGHSSSRRNNGGNVPAILDVSSLIIDNIAVLGTTTEMIVLGAKKIVESPVGSAVTKTVTTAGVVGGGIAASSIFAMNGTAAADLLLLPFKLWGLLLSALGLKKRNRPWGTVYDSVTKQPIDPAYVTLKKIGTKEENTSITDLDGRYGFLVTTGKYTLEANKTNYTFPSKKLLGRKEDALYNNLYFGEEINVSDAGTLISQNIPMDPIKFDWNEFVKGQKKIMKFYSRREKIVRIVTDWIFNIGFVVSILSLFLVSAPYNLIIFGLYIILALFRKFGYKQKALGSLTDKNNDPLPFAIVRAFSAELNVEITNKVADMIGRYYCLVPKGKYYVKVEKKNDDESYSLVYTSPVIDAEGGIINKNIVI